MKVSADKIEGSQVVLNIEVDPEEMENAIQQAYRRLGAKTAVPGFRKGKAPHAVLERFFGREALVEDAAEHLLPEVYDRAVRDQGVEPIAEPKVDLLKVDPLAFKATVPVRPTIELGDYHKIRLEPEQVTVTDGEVKEALESIRYMEGTWEPVERPAKSGDLLSIEVEGTAAGKSVISDKNGWYHLSLEAPVGVPGFAQQLEGAEKGKERAFTLTLPADFGELAGQECDFKVTVNEVKERKLPELNDDLAKGLGQGVETLDALREKVAANLKTRKEWDARERLEEKAIDALVDLSRVEYPDILVQSEIDRLIAESQRRSGERGSLEDYLKSVKKTQDEIRNELRPTAERMVVRSLIVQRFAELEKIEVGDDEAKAEVQGMMQRASDDRLRELLGSPTMQQSMRRNLHVRKALDRLVAMATGGEASQASKEEPVVSPTQGEGDKDGNAAQ